MTLDRNGLEILSKDECLAFLRSASVARVGITVDALPVVLPVNFTVERDRVVLRSALGSKVSAALANNVVALEADGFDAMSHDGWSVLVQGMSRVVQRPDEVAAASRLPLRPWANDDADQYVEIDLDRISGRRLCHWERLAESGGVRPNVRS